MNWDPVQEVQAVFGGDALALADRKVVGALKIPDDAKNFLATVGLPSEYDTPFAIQFDLSLERISSGKLEELIEKPLPVSKVTDFRRLGSFSNTGEPICVSNDQHGYVVSTQSFLSRMGLVNSSVQLLGGFLALYERTLMRGDPLYRKTFEPIARAADPEVIADTESFWSRVLEEMRDWMEYDSHCRKTFEPNTRAVDPEMIADEKNIWSRVWEQIRDGFF